MISKAENKDTLKLLPYTQVENDKLAGLKVFGDHNRSNLNGALIACLELGISEVDFWNSIADFEGADKRLQNFMKMKIQLSFLILLMHRPK